MHRHTVRPIGVNGNVLAPRERWFCLDCMLDDIRINAEALNLFLQRQKQSNFQTNFPVTEDWQNRRLREEKAHHDQKKREWLEEQERRRIRNLLKGK